MGKVFQNVAKNYDIMNDFMSVGIHRLWKDELIQTLAPGPGTNLLDVAGGTGDIAFRFLNYVKNMHSSNDARVQVVDINPSMLDVGRSRAQDFKFYSPSIEFHQGNAQDLVDIDSESVDAYTIAFGIRNCTHIDQVLKEAYRVLKPGIDYFYSY